MLAGRVLDVLWTRRSPSPRPSPWEREKHSQVWYYSSRLRGSAGTVAPSPPGRGLGWAAGPNYTLHPTVETSVHGSIRLAKPAKLLDGLRFTIQQYFRNMKIHRAA